MPLRSAMSASVCSCSSTILWRSSWVRRCSRMSRMALAWISESCSWRTRASLAASGLSDERERRDEAGEAEDIGRKERQDGPLLAHHPADQGADRDEERELADIRAQPEDRAHEQTQRLIGAATEPVRLGRQRSSVLDRGQTWLR